MKRQRSENDKLDVLKSIKAEASSSKKYINYIRASVDERFVIKAWNGSDYIRTKLELGVQESRNLLFPFKQIAKTLPLIRKALKATGKDELLRTMKAYFRLCSKGNHIWGNSNHGFKTLTGFLYKVIEVYKSKTKPWWDDENDIEAIVVVQLATDKLAVRLSSSFAKSFLKETTYDFREGEDIKSFLEGAEHLRHFVAKHKRKGLEMTNSSAMLFAFKYIEEKHIKTGAPVRPRELASSTLWNVDLPQYLKEKRCL